MSVAVLRRLPTGDTVWLETPPDTIIVSHAFARTCQWEGQNPRVMRIAGVAYRVLTREARFIRLARCEYDCHVCGRQHPTRATAKSCCDDAA